MYCSHILNSLSHRPIVPDPGVNYPSWVMGLLIWVTGWFFSVGVLTARYFSEHKTSTLYTVCAQTFEFPGSGGQKPPVGSGGKAPVEDLGDKIPRSLRKMWNYCVVFVNVFTYNFQDLASRSRAWTAVLCGHTIVTVQKIFREGVNPVISSLWVHQCPSLYSSLGIWNSR